MEQTPYKPSQSIFVFFKICLITLLKQTGQKDIKQNTIIPVTIRMAVQLSESTIDDDIVLDDVRIDCLSIAARITDYNDQQSKLLLQFDDSTGQLIGLVYKVKNSEMPDYFKAFELEGNLLVKAIIQIRTFKQKKLFTVLHIKPITDYNEFTFHLLSACRMHSWRQKGPIKRSQIKEALSTQNSKLQQQGQSDEISNILLNNSLNAIDQLQKVCQYLCEKSISNTFTSEQIEKYFPDKIQLRQNLNALEQNGILMRIGNEYKIL